MDVLLAVSGAQGDRLKRHIVQEFPRARVTAAAPQTLAALLDGRSWDLVVVADETLRLLDGGTRASLGTKSLVAVPDTASQDLAPVEQEIAVRLRDTCLPPTAADQLTGPDASRRASVGLQQFVETHRDNLPVMHEILQLFAVEAPERLASIEAALPDDRAGCDYAAVAKAAHSLANTCGTLQCAVAVEEARALESAARDERPTPCLVHAGRLAPIVTALVEAVQSYLARLS